MVLSTVATCTAMVKVMLLSPSTPVRADVMARWPLLLTGRYSVRPCMRPMMMACMVVMLSGLCYRSVWGYLRGLRTMAYIMKR